MTDHKPNESNIAAELKEIGRQLTETVKAVATSEQVRTLGAELRDGFREAAQNVEETLSKLRERDEVQRLRVRANDVAESFRTGEAQREIREEVSDALRALNLRLGELLERVQPKDSPSGPPNDTSHPAAGSTEESYTGETRRL